MKKYSIKKIGKIEPVWYRVDKRHWFLFIPYWDQGATDMAPNYIFYKHCDAVDAIRKKLDEYIKF